MNSKHYASLLSLSLLALCGCVGQPELPPVRPVQAPNPDLMEPLPEQGSFRKRLDKALNKGQTSAPTSTP